MVMTVTEGWSADTWPPPAAAEWERDSAVSAGSGQQRELWGEMEPERARRHSASRLRLSG